jgi:hypothetical protein
MLHKAKVRGNICLHVKVANICPHLKVRNIYPHLKARNIYLLDKTTDLSTN